MAKNAWNQANLFESPPPDEPRKVTVRIPPGTRATTCAGETCGAQIFWVVTGAGKRLCVDADGTPHWATCPDRASFKRRA